MKDFFNRNKPVFFIALVTVIIFIAIIVLAQKTASTGPSLKKIENVQLVSNHTYTTGAVSPKVTLVEFSDFECPACKAFDPTVRSLVQKYGKDLQLAYRNYPLPQHTEAKQAAIAAQAAGVQGKFWDYAELLYQNQDKLQKDDLIKYAEETGMNVEKFKKDLEDPIFATQVDDDIQLGNKLGINATPTFILNNTVMDFNNPQDFETQIVDALKQAGVVTDQAQQQMKATQDTTEQQTTTAQNIPAGITPSADVVTIQYSADNGFTPNNLKLPLGQRVKFINTSDKEITIRQLIRKYYYFDIPMKLASKAEFEFVLTEPDLWTFKEDSVRHYGSIFVTKE